MHVGDAELSKVDVIASSSSKLLQHLLKLLVLRLQLSNHFVLRAFIDCSFVFDLLCSVGIPQCAQCFLIVHERWRERADHNRLRVSTESCLQDSSQSRVSVGYDLALSFATGLVRQNTDALAQGCQALIDSTAFLQSVSRRAGLASFLRTRQIYQVDGAYFLHRPASLLDHLLEFDCDDRVRS